MRSPRTATKSSPCSPQLEKARAQQQRSNADKKKKKLRNSSATVETPWQFVIKLNIPLPFNPAVPLLGVYLSEMKTYYSKLNDCPGRYQVLTLGTCKCSFIWKRISANVIKLGSWYWKLSRITMWAIIFTLIREGQRKTGHTEGGRWCEDGGRAWSDAAISPGMSGAPGAGTACRVSVFLPTPWFWPWNTISDSGLQDCAGINFHGL